MCLEFVNTMYASMHTNYNRKVMIGTHSAYLYFIRNVFGWYHKSMLIVCVVCFILFKVDNKLTMFL